MNLGFLKNKNTDLFLGLDIGTESVKAAVLFKENAEDCKVLGYSASSYEKYGVFNTRHFFKDLLKNTILKTVKEARQNVALSETQPRVKERINNCKEWKTVLTFNPEHLKTRIAEVSLERESGGAAISKKEKKNIEENIFFQARKKISNQFARESGILGGEIKWISFKILAKKIDGYEVSDLADHKGKKLDFEIMAVFSPKYYLKNLESVLREAGLRVVKILSLAESIPPQRGDFLDVGGGVSQGICFKESRLRYVFEFSEGGKGFTEILSESLGIDEVTAENLKKSYSSCALKSDTAKRIRNIFARQRIAWYNSFKDKTNFALLPPSILNIMGGGAEIPDIRDALKEELIADFKKSGFNYPPDLKKFYPKDIKNGLKILTQEIDSIQATPLLFVCSNFNFKENGQ